MFNMNNLTILSHDILKNNNSYYKTFLGVNKFYKEGITGKNLTCAVIDTGCDYNHSLIKDKIIGGANFISSNKQDFMDRNGHGTHVAGLISSNAQGEFEGGIAPDSKLLICKALGDNGSGNINSLINAIYYAIEQKVDVINMSLGGNKNIPELYKAIKEAHEANIIICCASGNNSKGDQGAIDEFCYPGAYQEVIEVGAINKCKQPSYFSNSNNLIDCVSYGERILSIFPNEKFALLDGTSQATPLVSGCVLLIKQWFLINFERVPSVNEIYATLIKCSVSLNDYNKKQVGFGYIDLSKL